jgi:glutaminyl-tRNA synthetase
MAHDKTTPASPPANTADAAAASNFLRTIIERDLAAGTYAQRHFAGTPGDAAHHAAGPLDTARIRTRFPPEPNGYLHVGHAKAICLNFGLAQAYGGVCHLRFDDTNPEKEEQEFVDAIIEAVQWLGFTWVANETTHLYYASQYFDFMYRAAEALVGAGLAYVDEQSAEDMRANRGDFTTPGTNSPYRSRTAADNLARLRQMRAGDLADGAAVLRAKIDMASPNINLRDPTLYRIKRATHHATGNAWCIYPMYAYAHPIEDALENITHSMCTLEFEDQRPWYDWLLQQLATLGLLAQPLPKQIEFGRLNLSYVVTSKRKLRALVDEGIVTGWDDPRMPTLFGMRRRGYTPASVRAMADGTGASKSNIWLDYAVLDGCLRTDLEGQAPRAMAVLDPLPLVLTNWAEEFGSAQHTEPCTAPAHPQHPEMGQRQFGLGAQVWVERDDFAAVPAKGFFRLYPPQTAADGNTTPNQTPGNKVRLKYGLVVECTGFEADAAGHVTRVLARVVPNTRSGTPGADAVKVKGTITWVGVQDAVPATVMLYDRLFTEAQPDAGGRDFHEVINPKSVVKAQAYLEPGLAHAKREQRFQFERHGYFVADRISHSAGAPVFNRITTLKDSWAA